MSAAADASEHSLSWQVFGSGALSITPREEGDLYVKIVDSDGELLWSGTHEWGFWNSRVEKGQIKNEAARRHVQTKAEVEAELAGIWTELAERADEDEQFLISPAVSELLENTERVERCTEPEERYEIVVTAKRTGTSSNPNINMDEPVTRTLTFTEAEWNKSKGGRSGPPLIEKYLNNFYGLVSINWKQWREDVRPAWEEMIESRDGPTEEAER
jgi:hypothetical protein